MKPSLTAIISVVFLAYIAYSIWVIYGVFFPKSCKGGSGKRCIKPYIARNPKLEMQIFTSTKEVGVGPKDLDLVWKYKNFSLTETAVRTFNVSIPMKTRKNGTLFLHVFVHPRGEDPFVTKYSSFESSPITSYALPQSETFNLLGEKKDSTNVVSKGVPISHWRSKVVVNVLEDNIAFDRNALMGEIYQLIRNSPDGDYLPIVYIDQLSFRVKDLQPITEKTTQLPLTITYSPISIGKLRMWLNMIESFGKLHDLGFTEKDTDEIKGMFADTNFYFLMLTFTVAAFHLLFDFLAFKNDITYWKNRDTMVGLSTRAVVWRCISTIIIFLYLLDEETSLLVLIPAGIGTIIEVWKVKKAFKLKISWEGLKPSFEFGITSEKEKETENFDSQAMKYLLYLLYPLCLGGAVYSLLYVEHKSWYSWCIHSLVNGVYAFGFLFMLPQLFVNYKMKSVAHLPWRAFMYKAFNTFIDDVFAFIITMPTAHRLACFRDDVVFVIYLYQRWLYPVDKARVNEFGMSFKEEAKKKKE